MNQDKFFISEDKPLYNIRIIRNHVDFVKKNFPKININNLLDYAGISKLQFNDFGYWCTQRQINKLNEILVKQTGNQDISRNTGRHLLKSQNILAQYVLGFKSPITAVLQSAKIYSKLSLGAEVWGKENGKSKVEFFAKPNPGVNEQFFQCRNRIGILEGVYHFFTDEFPEIQHSECVHKGGKFCKYIVSWNKTSKIFKWSRLRNYSIIGGALISVFSFVFSPLSYFFLTLLLVVFVHFFLIYNLQKIKKDKLSNNIQELAKTAEDLFGELNVRYSSTKLVQEVGEITSFKQSENEISAAVSDVMSRRLDYDRGAILLARSNKRSLFYSGGYGFTEDQIGIMNLGQFRLDKSEHEGILQKVFAKQKPVLIEEINTATFSPDREDLDIIRTLKIQSMICVPIVHEGESLGVIIVDSLKSQREFREGDINILMAVASQTALNIINARSYKKLQESEKKHRTLVETIRDIVYTVDLEGRFTYISPMVEMITGYADKELIGREFIEIVNFPYKEIVMQRFEDGLKSKETSTYEIEIITKDENVVPVELNVAPLTDNKGLSIGRIGVARDITVRCLQEAKRQEMEMRALTQDKLASLGEIATGVAHEINQPLSYIKIILESTLNDIETEKLDRVELSGDFNESLRQIGKISNIISHLRTFGRSDVTTFSPVSLSRVLNDTLILMKERLRIQNIEIDIEVAEKFPLVFGNHAKLEQVFVNLIQNSMDAIEGRGKGAIKLTAQIEDNDALITYADTGEGIDPKFQEKIFEPFFTTKKAGKGTGIGLSIVYGIIKEHEGAITCESEKDKGATFKIRLPIFSENDDTISSSLNA